MDSGDSGSCGSNIPYALWPLTARESVKWISKQDFPLFGIGQKSDLAPAPVKG